MRRLLILFALVAAAAFFAPPFGVTAFRPAFIEAGGEHGIPEWAPAPSRCRTTLPSKPVTGNVNVINGDGLVQLGSNRGCGTPQNEPSIAVNPRNPDDLVAGSNDYRLCCDQLGRNDGTGWAYLSHDGGKTWADEILPGLTVETNGHGFFGHIDSAGDPAVAYTSAGAPLYANIVFGRLNHRSGIVLSRSADGGRTWRAPQLLARTNDPAVFLDKVAIASGPHGLVAVTWTRFDQADGPLGSVRLYGRVSGDGGATFAPTVELAPGQIVSQGTAPAFAPDGTLYVAYETVVFQPYPADVVAYSYRKPGQRAFRVVGVAEDFDGCYPANSDDRATLTGQDFRVTSFPVAAVDPSTGTLAIVWADGEQGCDQTASDSQVKLVTAHLGHHSQPRTITAGADKTMPAVAYQDGVVTVGFYTLAFPDFPGGVDYGYASSADGFLEHRLSDGSSDTRMQFSGRFIGDYTAAAEGSDGVVHFAWTDDRGADQNIFAAAVAPR